jgi:hypothetical protein
VATRLLVASVAVLLASLTGLAQITGEAPPVGQDPHLAPSPSGPPDPAHFELVGDMLLPRLRGTRPETAWTLVVRAIEGTDEWRRKHGR